MSTHYRVIVIGTGPAGFTAALYASRANLEVAIFEGQQPGGQLTITTEVENYPGFEHGIQGPEMMDTFRKQAQRFGTKSIYETIIKVDFSERPFKLWSESDQYTADAVIIATGAKAKLLDIPSQDTYWGAGISACATCDGFFFKGEKIFVIGGGDTAMEEANYLTHFGESVTLVHRRDEFRASKIMVERTQKNPKIKIITNAVVDEFLGEEKMGIKKLTHIRLKDTVSGETSVHEAGGCFIAIGHTPNSDIFGDFLDKDENGYLITEGKSTKTRVPGVFACGDVQDHVYRQAVTAAGSGCMAAIDAERWLAEQE
ncbi:MAG: thioredoxin-disulfide reductase [Candidatus Kapabacteria bacterium]|nr:thioredoxin-disulfide reductase [Ignavibacteriota bacterium]MCW5886049.1 thioredoxin-disulfide reductase [Candidatus Kapabacteria bacterium]